MCEESANWEFQLNTVMVNLRKSFTGLYNITFKSPVRSDCGPMKLAVLHCREGGRLCNFHPSHDRLWKYFWQAFQFSPWYSLEQPAISATKPLGHHCGLHFVSRHKARWTEKIACEISIHRPLVDSNGTKCSEMFTPTVCNEIGCTVTAEVPGRSCFSRV